MAAINGNPDRAVTEPHEIAGGEHWHYCVTCHVDWPCLGAIEQRDAEIERLRALLDPTLTFRDMEMKVRDGSFDLRAVMGEESQPVFRLLAGIMLHFVLGEGGPDDLEEPPNYRSGELVLKPGGGFEEIHAAIEIVKPGGKSSHQIRMELEAEVAQLRAGNGHAIAPPETAENGRSGDV